MSFAIDFTASNGELSDYNSLHKQDLTGRVLNQYEQALLSVGKVMEPYAMNQQFATFGFGGIPRFMGSNQVSHCFNLNGLANPQIQGLNNVFAAYKSAIAGTGLAGPTYFAHVLTALKTYVQQCLQFQMYHCLMILTDGEIHDMQQTIDLIFPVSIIIIGVGNENFEKMETLDSDDKILRNKFNQAAQRDIVQFVRFREFATSDISMLAEEVLKEMPEQIVGYMMANGIKPQKLEWSSVDSVLQVSQLSGKYFLIFKQFNSLILEFQKFYRLILLIFFQQRKHTHYVVFKIQFMNKIVEIRTKFLYFFQVSKLNDKISTFLNIFIE